MSLAKKCDTRDRLSTGRNRSQHSFRPVGHTDRASSSGIEADGAGANRQSFAEDFLLEHTHPSLRITVIGMSGNSGSMPREQNQSAQCYGFPS
jgi:hypothetical protein